MTNVLSYLSKYLKKGRIIILRSTVAPTTTEYTRALLEKNTGLVVGKDFF
ncbi:hypothetical protein JN080_14430 [Bacillus sp. EB600]|nr:hypothetical protein [Bacillus sp. EB600]